MLSTVSYRDKQFSYLQLKISSSVKSKIGRDSPKNAGRVASLHRHIQSLPQKLMRPRFAKSPITAAVLLKCKNVFNDK
jgi:hypothetical protein